MNGIIRCQAQCCLHKSRDIINSKAVMDGGNSYHPDCYIFNKNLHKIQEIWKSKIDSKYSSTELVRVVKSLVLNKKIDSEMILYGVRYYVNNKIPLRYPQGLNYVVTNREVIDGFNRLKESRVAKLKIKITLDDDPLEASYTYTPIKEKGIGDIFDN